MQMISSPSQTNSCRAGHFSHVRDDYKLADKVVEGFSIGRQFLENLTRFKLKSNL